MEPMWIGQTLFVRGTGVLLLALGAACGGAADHDRPSESLPADDAHWVEAVDDAGRLVRLPAPATRVISLLPAVTETLVAMGATDKLVARTEYDVGPLGHLPSIGGGLTPSLELLASLRPDLVIAWEESGLARVRPRLEELGIPVFAAQTQDTAGIYANIERLGRLVGRGEQADSLAAWMRAELAAVRASVADREAPEVLYLIGVDPPIVAGPNVFIGEILSLAGGRNAFPELREESPQMSLEEVVRRRPELVLFPSSGPGGTDAGRLRAAPGWSELARAGTTRFHALPAELLHRPGPSIVEAAWILRDAIHPDLAGRR